MDHHQLHADRSSRIPQPSPQSTPEQLYTHAWTHYAGRCLWNVRQAQTPTVADYKATARALKAKGDMQARRLADRLEEAARAA